MPVNKMELFQNMGGGDAVASRLMAHGFHVNSLRPWIGKDNRPYVTVINKQTGKPEAKLVGNATLRYDEWKEIDRTVMEAAYQRLTIVRDLEAAGLTVPLSNGFAKMVFQSQKQSDVSAAEFSMDAATPGTKDRPVYGTDLLPMPVAHKDFDLGVRTLEASRVYGDPLDLGNAALAGRKVGELIESTIINGASITYGGGTIYGLVNQTNVNTITMSTYTGSGGWDGSTGVTGAQILNLVVAMKQSLITDRHYGPYNLYIPTAYETILDKDFDSTAANPLTIRERLLKIENIMSVKVADFMPADTVILVEMQPETIRLIDGLNITTVEWSNNGGMTFEYKVMAIRIPQVRADYNGRSGICVAS